jgi:putative transposase
MARLPRLALAGHTHCVIQRAASGRRLFADDSDRAAYLQTLDKAARLASTAVYGWALLDDEVRLLLHPAAAESLSRLMQTLARTHAARINRRDGPAHASRLWLGRYRCTVLEPGPWRLLALRWLDGPEAGAGRSQRAAAAGPTAGHGARATDPPEYWTLGNTPFERERAWQRLLAEPLAAAEVSALRAAAIGGWALGSAGFVQALGQLTPRPLQPRRAGRPAAAP